MKKIELVYSRDCPTVPAAKDALRTSGLRFTEVIQEEIPLDDPRRKYSSPALLVEEKLVLGCAVQGDSCSIDRWDSKETKATLSQLTSPEPLGCCIGSEPGRSLGLSQKQKVARIVAGLGFLLMAYVLVGFMPLAAILAWFGASHIIAGVTSYTGCPELGAIPSLFLRREVSTGCGPWVWLDRKLRLSA